MSMARNWKLGWDSSAKVTIVIDILGPQAPPTTTPAVIDESIDRLSLVADGNVEGVLAMFKLLYLRPSCRVIKSTMLVPNLI